MLLVICVISSQLNSRTITYIYQMHLLEARGLIDEIQGRQNAFPSQTRMRLKNLVDCLTCGEFLQNQLNGNARSCDDGFTHHDCGVGLNEFSFHVSFPYERT